MQRIPTNIRNQRTRGYSFFVCIMVRRSEDHMSDFSKRKCRQSVAATTNGLTVKLFTSKTSNDCNIFLVASKQARFTETPYLSFLLLFLSWWCSCSTFLISSDNTLHRARRCQSSSCTTTLLLLLLLLQKIMNVFSRLTKDRLE